MLKIKDLKKKIIIEENLCEIEFEIISTLKIDVDIVK